MIYSPENQYLVTHVWDFNVHRLADMVRQHEIRKCILFSQTEWCFWNYGNYIVLIKNLQEKNLKLQVVVGAHNIDTNILFVDRCDIFYYPTYFFTWAVPNVLHQIPPFYNTKPINQLITDLNKLDYKYHFICMNQRAHTHRMRMIDILAKENLIDGNAISWHNILSPLPPYADEYHFKYFKPQVMNLSDGKHIDQHVLPKEYYQSFAQLCVESNTAAIFITEKTITPLLIGKPFLVAGAKGFHSYLSELGFKLYDELFDYSFDTVDDTQLRFEMIAHNFKKLSRIPLVKLRNLITTKLQHKINYNRNLALKYSVDTENYPEPVKEICSIYETTGECLDDFTVFNHYMNSCRRKLLKINKY